MKCSCGSNLFHRTYRAQGQWSQLIVIDDDNQIEIDDTNLDGLRHGREPKTIKCADCGKKSPNPEFKL